MTDKLEHEIRNLLISQGCFTDEIKTRLEYVSKMLGHDSISTTQIYLDISDSDLEKYHELYVR